MKTIRHLLLAALAASAFTPMLHAQVPQLLNYQGRVAVGSINFDGTGQFKFALVSAEAPAIQAAATAVMAPGSSLLTVVAVPVTNTGLGYFTPPTVSFSPPGAVAQAIVAGGRVLGINVTNGGNYAAPPTVIIGPPTPGIHVATYWSNSPDTAPADGVPDSALSLSVTKGLYSVLLGDTSLGAAMAAIPASVWSNADVRLRVWFNDGTTGFQRLAPDQRLAPNGYLPDGSVSSAAIASGAVSSTKIASNAVTTAKIAPGAVGSAQIASGAITSAQISNSLELGTTTADGTLSLWDNGTDLETIQLAGGSSAVSIFGTDGQIQVRLRDNSSGFGVPVGDPFGGVLELYNDAAENHRTVLLGADETGANPGGVLRLANAAEEEVYLNAHSSGGLFQLSRANGIMTVEVRAEEATTAGGSIETKSATGVSQFTLFNDTVEGGAEMQLKGATGVANIVLEARDSTTEGGGITLRDAANVTTVQLKADDTTGSGGNLRLRNASGASTVFIEASQTGADGGQIIIYNSAGEPALILDAEFGALGGRSRVITGTVEITGGADLSEQFHVHPAQGQSAPEPGMIVCIDPARPGELRTSSRAYDRTVAGIISGAGGVRPGMLMGQRDSLADGAHPIALSGRVYCYVDTAEGGPVVPGDLLTTSATPGHAMKVTDHDQARGAIIGKAMTGMAEGAGLVLVLVSLQ